MSFVHLHNHTHYSMLDGLAKPMDYANRTKERGEKSCAITDHGAMNGAIDFYKTFKKADLHPIIGCEFYLAKYGRTDMRPNIDNKSFHLILLARNQIGYKNLLELATIAQTEGYYYKPRIDHEILAKHSEGIIGLSACLAGEISRALLENDEEKAKKLVEKYKSYFGAENFYIEIQSHPKIQDQKDVNKKLFELAKKTNTEIVVTNDCHYAKTEDAEIQDALLCIETGKMIADINRMKMSDDFSMKSEKQTQEELVEEGFIEKDIQKFFKNTVEIADRCKVEFDFGKNLIPSFEIKTGETTKEYLRKKCEEGINKKYECETEEIKKRLDYELGIIDTMGFNEYFLIVWDFVKFAKDQKILVGPGRGSAAGSLASYLLDITDIDPLKYGLLFERFLNPNRVSMPDIDIDFADYRREEVLDYTKEKYGEMNVAQISTFGTFAARAAMKDIGRVMGMSFEETNKIAKLISDRPGTKLKDAVEEKDLKKLIKKDKKIKKLFKMAMKLEGGIRHTSVHACAIIISDKKITNYAPLQRIPKQEKGENQLMTQYSMKPLEELGLLKMDFLGLKNLTIIEKTINMIKQTKNKEIDLKKINIKDKKTFKIFSEGKTTGVFQFESGGMRRYLKELKPNSFEDIIAMVSLYRPGPMDWIPDYIAGKKGKKVKYVHKDLESILKPTYGVGVYQEQVLKIAEIIGGFSLGEADILRRAIGKKIQKELDAQKDKFIKGAIKKGYKKTLAIKIFEDVIEPFAGYGFNKSHAAGYAMIAYQTAFLKTHYPVEFMTSLMSTDKDRTEKLALEIEECEEMNIKVTLPNINESLNDFTAKEKGKKKIIHFGLSAIKGMGGDTVKIIIDEREENGPFKNIKNFAKRLPSKVVNKKTIEALTYSGAFDIFKNNRTQVAQNFKIISDYAKNSKPKDEGREGNLFADFDEADFIDEEEERKEIELKADFDKKTQLEILNLEKQFIGIFLSSHPLKGLSKYFRANKKREISKLRIGKKEKTCGIISKYKKLFVKKTQKPMAQITIEDIQSEIAGVIFPNTFETLEKEPEVGDFITVEGNIDSRDGEKQIKIIKMKTMNLDELSKKAKKQKLFDKNETISKGTEKIETIEIEEIEIKKNETSEDFFIFIKNTETEKLKKLKKILEKHKGNRKVFLMIKNNNDYIKKDTKISINENENIKKEIINLFGVNSVL